VLLPVLIAAVAGYLLGSLPFGYFVARANGVDIFAVGSKSPGATNVMRSVGRKAGYTVYALDALKGALAAGWPVWAGASLGSFAADAGRMQLVGLVFALIGHSFSCFTKFKGGKGVATASGGLVVIMPLSALVCAAVWLVVFLVSRYVSLASILASALLPVSAAFFSYRRSVIVLAAVVGLFVIVNHRANIVRLAKGTENRFGKKPASPS
jgi:glycerol-3-phosphate acyltransferase PlsY